MKKLVIILLFISNISFAQINFETGVHLYGVNVAAKFEIKDDLNIGSRINYGRNSSITIVQSDFFIENHSFSDVFSKEIFIERKIKNFALEGYFKQTGFFNVKFKDNRNMSIKHAAYSMGVNAFHTYKNLKIGLGINYTSDREYIHYLALNPLIVRYMFDFKHRKKN